MKTYSNRFGHISGSLLAVFLIGMIGCGETEEPVTFLQAIPGNGSTIKADATIIASFDGTPTGVTVTGGEFAVVGANVTITGPFTPGTLNIIITWEGGAQPLTYTVETDEPPIEEIQPVRPVEEDALLLRVSPDADSTIVDHLTILYIEFDRDPGEVTTNIGIIEGSGRTRTIRGEFPIGPISLTITWENSSMTLSYFVVEPDIDPPKIVSTPIQDGDEDVDPKPFNEDGIEITFNEDVVGTLRITTENDEDIGWISKAEGNKITLTPEPGTELTNENIYIITGTVIDAAANELEVNILFVTGLFE